jgi:hypothetical protein
MKYLFILSIVNIFCFSSKSQKDIQGVKKNVKILEINDTLIKECYHITFINLKGEKGILISKKQEIECKEILEIDKTYSLLLHYVTTTTNLMDDTDVSFRLYQNDIYIDEKLVFPSSIKVYTATSLKGLCFN